MALELLGQRKKAKNQKMGKRDGVTFKLTPASIDYFSPYLNHRNTKLIFLLQSDFNG